MKRYFPLFGAFIAIAILTLTLKAIHKGPASAPDYELGQAGDKVIVTILEGETGSDVAAKLFAAGVVKSVLSYFRVAVTDSRSLRVAPGDHEIDSKIPATEALSQLLDKDRIPGLIEVSDGARLTEVIARMMKLGYKKSDIESALSKISLPLRSTSASPEGFLYPAHYSFVRGTNAEQVFEKMISTFTARTAKIDFNKVVAGYSGYELLVIASLIQAEADLKDFAKVSRVIYNRLKIKMPLQLDTTVQYLLNRRGEITLSLKDTKIKSEYNTYQRYGLPPGPIGSPTLAAIEAALNPSPGNWIYFITVAPGDTRFTDSHSEFLTWKAEYKKNVKAGLFEVKK